MKNFCEMKELQSMIPGASHGDHVYSLKTYVVIETNGNRCLTE